MLAKDAHVGMVVVAIEDRGDFRKGDKFIVEVIDPEGVFRERERMFTLRLHPDNEPRERDKAQWFAWRVEPYVAPEQWIENNGDYEPQVGDVVQFKDMNARENAHLRNMLPWWIGNMDRFAGAQQRVSHIDADDPGVFEVEQGNGYRFGAQWVEKYKRDGVVAPAAPIQFKKGDWVKVVKQHVEGKIKRLKEVDATIGQVYRVKSFDERTKTYLLDNGYSYLIQSLTKATDEEVKAKKAKKPALSTVIAQARKELIPNINPHSCCNFAVFTRDTKGTIRVHDETDAPCHAALDRTYVEGGGIVGKNFTVVGVLDFLNDYKENIEKEYIPAYRKYVEWMVNESPWASAYHRKSLKNIFENGILLDVSKPAVMIGSACISMRYMKEFDKDLPLFKRLLKEGFPVDVAYLTTYSFDPALNGNPDTFVLGYMSGGHQVFYSGMNAGGVLSFLANGFDEKVLNGKPYSLAPTYRGIHQTISDTTNVLGIKGTWNKFVLDNVAFEERKEGWTKVNMCKWADVLKFARVVQEQINKARELKANAIINEQKAAA